MWANSPLFMVMGENFLVQILQLNSPPARIPVWLWEIVNFSIANFLFLQLLIYFLFALCNMISHSTFIKLLSFRHIFLSRNLRAGLVVKDFYEWNLELPIVPILTKFAITFMSYGNRHIPT